jgi:MoaA/NifB/PqqE/SkfB family radical SAM enzyme
MIEIPHLEWHISHSCNLSCESCIHFTNHNHSEVVSIEKLKEWYSLWNKKVSPKRMILLGGEPFLNKNIIDIVYLTKEMWTQPKESNYWITTNGLLLENYPDLPKALRDTKCMLQISIHGDESKKEYYKRIKKVFSLIEDWEKKYNIKFVECNTDEEFQKLQPTEDETYVIYRDMVSDWTRAYDGFGINSAPFEDNNIKQSWDNCVAGQKCFQLYEGKIYKCCMTAYLNLQKNKYGNVLSKKWDPYLKYKPLESNCSDEDIINFFKKEEEPVCGMCPSNPQMFSKKDPTLPVSFYEKNNKLKYSY